MKHVSRLAFDYATSRTIDLDGRLHVRDAAISKACVNEYRGAEIVDAERLGLDPNRMYALFRDPEELSKGAPSFNSMPILSKHIRVDAADHQPGLVVGSTGSNAKFDGVYLRNELVVWSAAAIAAIDDRSVCELSCAYRYRPEMVSGTYGGQRYDIRMADLAGNHLALVPIGRAGPDVSLALDAQPSDLYRQWAKTVRRITA